MTHQLPAIQLPITNTCTTKLILYKEQISLFILFARSIIELLQRKKKHHQNQIIATYSLDPWSNFFQVPSTSYLLAKQPLQQSATVAAGTLLLTMPVPSPVALAAVAVGAPPTRRTREEDVLYSDAPTRTACLRARARSSRRASRRVAFAFFFSPRVLAAELARLHVSRSPDELLDGHALEQRPRVAAPAPGGHWATAAGGRGGHAVEDVEEVVLVAGERDGARCGREAVLLLRLPQQLQERRVAEVRHPHHEPPRPRRRCRPLHGHGDVPRRHRRQGGGGG